MEKQKLIEVTKKVYHLTLLFPKKEPLRYKIREVADNILEDFIGGKNPKIIYFLPQQLEVIDGFLEIAKAQNWVRSEELLEIQREYDNLKRVIIEITKKKNLFANNTGSENQEELSNSLQVSSGTLTRERKPMLERQEKILAFLREQGWAQVWQIKQILPEVTKRTLRRDFEVLLKQGLIERIGERNNTFYQIKNG